MVESVQKTKKPYSHAAKHRLQCLIPEELYERLEYFAHKHNISVTEFLIECIQTKIRLENADYDLPTLEQQRLRQLQDQIAAQTATMNNVVEIVTNGFDALLGLTRGDSDYLGDDDEDGA